MTKLTASNLFMTTAVQLAAFPEGMRNLLQHRTMPRTPGAEDKAMGIMSTLMGAVAGFGISTFAQNLQAEGTMAALTGSRLGLTELNWSSMGSALLVGAAIGASVGIATYLAREGHRAKTLYEERNSPSSQSNVSLSKMKSEGPESWAINRILEKDDKSFPRIEAAVLEHTMKLTHMSAEKANVHATIALSTAVLTRTGEFHPGVAVQKEKWVNATTEKLSDFPSAQLLLDTLSKLPSLKPQGNSLDMHSSWNTMINKQVRSPDADTFKAELAKWTETYLPDAHYRMEALAPACLEKVEDMSQDDVKRIAVYAEAAQTQVMVASVLLDTPVAAREKTKPSASEFSTGPSLGS